MAELVPVRVPVQVRCLVSDLDGVVRNHPAPSDDERRAGLPVGAVQAVAFSPDLLEAAVTGRCSDDQWRDAVVTEVTRRHPGADAAAAVAAWWRPGVVDRDVLDLLTAARARVPVVLLTNATTRLDADLRRLEIDTAFDAVVNTCRVGAAKPHARAFEAAHRVAADLLGEPRLCPGSLLLVDDRQANVAAVEQLGWQGHLFTGAGALRERLAEAGLITPTTTTGRWQR